MSASVAENAVNKVDTCMYINQTIILSVSPAVFESTTEQFALWISKSEQCLFLHHLDLLHWYHLHDKRPSLTVAVVVTADCKPHKVQHVSLRALQINKE